MYGCQQILLNPDKDLLAILLFLCQQANKLTNCGIYYARQHYFKGRCFIGKFDLEKEYKQHKLYKSFHSQAAQQILRSVYESFVSFKKLNKKYCAGELADKPRLPKYRRKDGMTVVSYPKQALRLSKDNQIKFPLGRQIKAWFGIDSFTVEMPSNLKFNDIKELRILPRNGAFYLELVYRLPTHHADVDSERFLSIDPGLDNWLTCVSNVGRSFIIDGRKVKSQNQLHNKRIAQYKRCKSQGFWDNRLATLAEKRNRQMRDNVNKAARFVINWCLTHRIGVVIFGWVRFVDPKHS